MGDGTRMGGEHERRSQIEYLATIIYISNSKNLMNFAVETLDWKWQFGIIAQIDLPKKFRTNVWTLLDTF